MPIIIYFVKSLLWFRFAIDSFIIDDIILFKHIVYHLDSRFLCSLKLLCKIVKLRGQLWISLDQRFLDLTNRVDYWCFNKCKVRKIKNKKKSNSCIAMYLPISNWQEEINMSTYHFWLSNLWYFHLINDENNNIYIIL